MDSHQLLKASVALRRMIDEWVRNFRGSREGKSRKLQHGREYEYAGKNVISRISPDSMSN